MILHTRWAAALWELNVIAYRMVTAEKEKVQDEVRFTRQQHEDEMCVHSTL